LAKKTAAAKSTASKEEIDAADTAFVLEQKKLRELQQTLKMERDRAAEAVRKAQEEAQAALDAAKAVELTPDQQLELVKAVGEVTGYEPSDDAEENLAAQEAALDRAKAFRKEYRRTMKDYQKASDKAEEQFGDSSTQFIEAERKYYLQKAKVDLITDLVQATKKAAAEA
jgi:AraC-like DNA-binding protein